jgi:hypothetical protein
MTDKQQCECGAIISRAGLARHRLTAKHQQAMAGQSGDGRILDVVKKGLSVVKTLGEKVGLAPRISLNNASTRVMNALGNKPISSLIVMRTPIESWINKAINMVSLGQWEIVKKQMRYDDLFHLALIAVVDGRKVVIEKNEVINIGGKYRETAKTQRVPVGIRPGLTIFELLEGARKRMGDKNFYLYSGFEYNCQNFIVNILEGSGLLTPQLKAFIYQDLGDFLKRSEHTGVLANALTYTASVANKLMGKGRKPRKKKGAGIIPVSI